MRPKRLWRALAIYLFVIPAMIPMTLIVGVPLVQTIFFSFTNLHEKNFSLWTLGLAPAEGNTAGCDAGARARVEKGGPAARAGMTDDCCVVEINGETVRSSPALRRLLGKAQREFLNKKISAVDIAYQLAGDASPRHASMKFDRQPFDWSVNPDRNRSTWGMVGWRNYRDILVPGNEAGGTPTFYRILGITALWTFINVALHYIIGLGLALLLNRNVPGTRFYRVLLLLPWAVPVYVSAFSWRWLFNNQYGFINVILRKLSVSPVPWLSDSLWTFVAVTVTNVWLGIPFMMVSLLAGLQTIPGDLYEAAEIDGCTRWQMLRTITLPLLRPVSLTIILLGAIWTFNMFNVIWLVQGGGNMVEILATYAFRLFRDNQDYAGAAAYGTIILLLLLIFSMFYLRIIRRGEQTV